MKTSFLSLCLIASSLFLFVKCKKDSSSPTTATVNYSPLTAGSTWTYNYTENASANLPFTLTVTGKDTVVNSRTYKVLTSSDATQNKYLAKSDSNYYRFASFANIGSFEELYLKDNRDVNGTWTATQTFNYSGSAIPANLTYLVKEKGVSRTVNGTVYNSVIHVRLDISVMLPIIGNSNIGGGDFYYAKDIGLIENSISVGALGQTFTSTETLTAHQIK